MMKVKSNNVVRQLAETKDVCNPNLLINADFKSGIINQRGQATYTGKTGNVTYTIDRWFCGRSPDSTLTVNDGYISVVLPENTSLGCFIEGDLNGALTLSVKFKDEDVQSLSLNNYIQDDYGNLRYDFGIIDGLDFHVIKYVQYGDTEFNLWIGNPAEAEAKTLNIEYIKLEKGSVYTGMPQWDEILETYKCICKQFLLGIGWANQYPARSDAVVHRIFIALPFKPKKSPSVVILNETKNGNVTLSGNINQTQNLNINTINVASISGNGVYLEIPLGTSQQIGYGAAVFNVPVMLDFNEY